MTDLLWLVPPVCALLLIGVMAPFPDDAYPEDDDDG